MTDPEHISLDELDRDGKLMAISHESAQALAGSGLVEARPEPGGWRLIGRGRVGSVRLAHLQVDVLPKDKVGLTRMLFLLGYANNPGFRDGWVHGEQADDLWPALAESLARLSRKAIDPGVMQGYRTVDETLRTVRGRIRIGDQLTRRPGQMVPVEVTYDDFTVDIPENRILRTAIRRMLAVPRLSRAAQESLGHLDGKLAGATVLPAGVGLPGWQETRLNSRYVPALRLAEVVLANTSAETGQGELRMASFVVDPAKVFEDFLGTALEEAMAGLLGRISLQHPKHLDEGRAIPMKIDAVHLVGNVPQTVFDAKYKAADANGQYANADHYQMLAYATALELPRAWLIYAGRGTMAERRVVNSPVTVVEYPIDLSREPAELLAEVDRLVDLAVRGLRVEGVA